MQVPSALLNDFTRGVSLLYHAGAVGAGDGGAGNARGSALPAKRAKLEAPVRGRGSPWLAVGDVLRGFPTGHPPPPFVLIGHAASFTPY